MTKPIFSISFSIEANAQDVFSAWLKTDFWRNSWHGKCQDFNLPAVSLKTRGLLQIQPLLPKYLVEIINLQPSKLLELSLVSTFHNLILSYSLTGNDPTIFNFTLSQTKANRGLNKLFAWLAKPYLHHHAIKVAENCRMLQITQHVSETNTQVKEEIIQKPTLPTLGFCLWQLNNEWQNQLDTALKKFNLTSTQWLLLFTLIKINESHSEANVSLLAKELDLHPVHVSDVISILVKKHYIHKIKLESDKRRFKLTPTTDGKIVATQANTTVIQAERKFFYSLDQVKKQQLAKLVTPLA